MCITKVGSERNYGHDSDAKVVFMFFFLIPKINLNVDVYTVYAEFVLNLH